MEDKRWYVSIGRVLLALCLLYLGVNTLLNVELFVSAVPATFGFPYLWVIVLGSFYLLIGLSFITNLATRWTGTMLALVMFFVMALSSYRGFLDSATLVPTFLKFGFYLAFMGGGLMVAVNGFDTELRSYKYVLSSRETTFVIGRVLVGFMFMFSGIIHFVEVEADAALLGSMPYAEFWVIFVGVCWIALALSLWFNIMTKTAVILGAIMLLIVVLKININAVIANPVFSSYQQIALNVGLLGACLLGASMGYYGLHRSTWRLFPKKNKY